MTKSFDHGQITLRRGDLVYAPPGADGVRPVCRVVRRSTIEDDAWILYKAEYSRVGTGLEELPDTNLNIKDLVAYKRPKIIFIERAVTYRSGDLVRHAEHGRGVVCKIDSGHSPEEDVTLVNFSGTKKAVLISEIRTYKLDGALSLLSDQIETEPEKRKKLPQTLHEQEVHY